MHKSDTVVGFAFITILRVRGLRICFFVRTHVGASANVSNAVEDHKVEKVCRRKRRVASTAGTTC